MTNHLANAISPYLLQHRDNPVDWYPWGDEALEKARREDKPIFLSIGYSACHWCHVMAHESFEDAALAEQLNRDFVSIKVDREERPDLDGIYMSAVVALNGQGGWPLSVFLTPDLQPFYGGTYFPPERRHGLPAFRDVLAALAGAWKDRRSEVLQTGSEIASHLSRPEMQAAPETVLSAEALSTGAKILADSYDWEHGGWGSAPKFPQPMAVEFLLRRHLGGDERALKPALHALSAMAQGGMYDVIGGGFCRYSTDPFWRVPHFEKMLYDNAQLARVYLHAWLVTHNDRFRRIAAGTLDFVARELTSPQGGFYSSLDADSDGEEGKYYVWTRDELRNALGTEDEFFASAYGLTESGNWESRTVLQRQLDDDALGSRFSLSREQVTAKLDACHARLMSARAGRLRPRTDDKILAGWNGLMLAAMAEGGRFLDHPGYLELATRCARHLLEQQVVDGRLRHAWRDGTAGQEAFLEDYAGVILGLFELYQADPDPAWYASACRLADRMAGGFLDESGGFFDTEADAAVVLSRPKELQDNATPCGNSLAAEALLKLSALDGSSRWAELAEKTLSQLPPAAARYPTAFAHWLTAADLQRRGIKQVAILAYDHAASGFRQVIDTAYRPNLILAVASYPPPPSAPALVRDRPLVDGKATAYVCEHFSCKLPVTSGEALLEQL